MIAIARLKACAFDADDDLSVVQRRRHGTAVNAQHRHPERRDQNGQRRNDDQDRDRTSERPVIFAFIPQPPAFVRELLRCRQIDGPAAVLSHIRSIPFIYDQMRQQDQIREKMEYASINGTHVNDFLDFC